MGWGVIGDAVDAVGDAAEAGLDMAEDAVDAAGEAVDFVVDLAEATLEECMKVLKGLVELGDEAVEQVIRHLGLPWPKADEGRLREMAVAYDRMALALDQAAVGTSPAARSVVAENKGLPIESFAAFWAQYDGNPAAWLPGTAAACRAQAAALRKLADIVEKQKTILKAEILAVAATILVGAGLLFVPGVNVVSGAAVTAATNVARGAATAAGIAISEAVAAAIGTIVGNAVVGAVFAITLDLAVAQPIKIAMGAQDGYTAENLAKVAAYGAGGGAFAGTMSVGAQQLPKLALPPSLASITAKAPAALTSIPGQAFAGAAGNTTVDAVTGNDVNIFSVLAGAAGGAAGAKATPTTARPGISEVLDGTPVLPPRGGDTPPAEVPLRVSTGARGSEPLTPEQVAEATAIAVSMGMPEEHIVYSDGLNTSWGLPWGQERLYIGTDVLPGNLDTANSQVSMRAALAHEVIGHREARLTDNVQANDYLEEAQASLRAAELTPGLTPEERAILRADAMARLEHAGVDPADFAPWMGRLE